VFHADERLNIKTEFPFETKVTIKILGVNTDVPVKGVIPLNIDIPLKHDFHIKDTLAVKPQGSLPFPINSVFDVPLDFMLHGKVPIDGMLAAPIKDKFNTDVILKDRLPITLEFRSFLGQKKVV
jgi:hypothetical protein